MLVIIDTNSNPYFNLACEEFLLKTKYSNEPIIRIWQNSPAIIIGKFQNTLAEINLDYVKNNNIAVVRRITGGGAVYHDLGNINYSIIQQSSSKNFDFSYFSQHIIALLTKYGIKAQSKGRNDIEINSQKISGGAQTISNNRILHHGTLLFSSDFNCLSQALKAKDAKLKTKGVQSIKARVGNIADFMDNKISLENFKTDLKNYFLNQPPSINYQLSPSDIKKIEHLVKTKYSTWDWNYGKSPDYNIERTTRYPWGELSIYLLVKNNLINKIYIYGDFFSPYEVNRGFSKLINTPFENESLKNNITKFQLWTLVPNLEEKQLLKQLSVDN